MGAGTNASIIRISLFPPSTCASAPREDRTWRLVLKQTQEAVQHTHSIHSEESRKETALPMSHVSSKDRELKSPTLCQCSFHREKKKLEALGKQLGQRVSQGIQREFQEPERAKEQQQKS